VTVDLVRDLVAKHPHELIPFDEAQELANALGGRVCLMCLEMARLHFHLSTEAEEHYRPAHLEEAGHFMSRVVTEAQEPQP
jgi:hypothetical protein